jgi:hypothetical protein
MKIFLSMLLSFISLVVRADPPAADKPAPAEDRVGFPQGYTNRFEVLRVVNKAGERKVITVYGNPLAASVTNQSQLPYPYGSVLVMETARVREDAEGKPLLDQQGNLQKATVSGMHVMRRESGFGAAYGQNRAGEWEYVEYKPDGSYITPPQKSASCAECHLKAGSPRDFVYKARFAGSTR